MQYSSYAFSTAAGAALFPWIEYVHHRWGGHTRALGARVLASHQLHHRDPAEGGVSYTDKLRQRAPLVLAALIVLGAPLVVVFGARRATAALAGLLLSYAWSEWFHHRIHHRSPRNGFERWMWRYHYVHHFLDPTRNYGFTSPIWDFVFRTARVEREVRVPHSRAPALGDDVDGIVIHRRPA